MPSTSRKQQRFMYAELDRLDSGKGTQTGMNRSQLEDFTKLAATAKAGHEFKKKVAKKKGKRGGC